MVISRGVLSWESRVAGVCTKTGLPLAICENFHRFACSADSEQRSDLVPPCSYCKRPHELSVCLMYRCGAWGAPSCCSLPLHYCPAAAAAHFEAQSCAFSLNFSVPFSQSCCAPAPPYHAHDTQRCSSAPSPRTRAHGCGQDHVSQIGQYIELKSEF